MCSSGVPVSRWRGMAPTECDASGLYSNRDGDFPPSLVGLGPSARLIAGCHLASRDSKGTKDPSRDGCAALAHGCKLQAGTVIGKGSNGRGPKTRGLH